MRVLFRGSRHRMVLIPRERVSPFPLVRVCRFLEGIGYTGKFREVLPVLSFRFAMNELNDFG